MTEAMFIDLSKAFDSIDHCILLKKLFSIGIEGREHEWFVDYLLGRMQIVGYQGILSDPETVYSRVNSWPFIICIANE